MEAPEEIRTDRLVLRRAAVLDAEALFAINVQPEIMHNLSREPSSGVHETVAFLERSIELWDAGETFVWTIELGGKVVGTIDARLSRHGIELGYLLDSSEWGNGYMTEAARAVTEWALSKQHVHRVWAYTDVDNEASRRVLEKLGMSHEGTLHRWVPRPMKSDVPADSDMYAIWN